MFSFKDKTAIVTGGARGIGADCVNSLLKMGIDVSLFLNKSCHSNIV